MARKLVLDQVYVNSTTSQPLGNLNIVPISQSLAADFNTVSTGMANQDNISYQIAVTTSNSTGAFYVQVSDDNSNWVDMGAAGTVAAANDVILVEVDPGARMYSRLRYDANTAGTGTCTIIVTAKNLGS